MYEEFDAQSQTKIVRDADGIARELSHANRYVATEAPTAAACGARLSEPIRRVAGAAARAS